MSRYLIVPDVHQKLDRLESILRQAGDVDGSYFLGDWFDDFGDTPAQTLATAVKLRELMADPKNKFIYGNHDLPYVFPTARQLRCSGWTPAKAMVLQPFIPEIRQRFKLFYQHGPWTLSHAGFHPKYAHLIDYDGCEFVMDRVFSDVSVLLLAGDCRGGDQEIGGCTWLDWDCEFKPICGVKQIVGHTPHLEPQVVYDSDGNENHCIDTHLNHYMILVDDAPEIHKRKP